MSKAKGSAQLFQQLSKVMESEQGAAIAGKIKGIVVFKIDGEGWTLDARPGEGKLYQGKPDDAADLTLSMSDDNFVKLVMGKLNPQQAFLMGKLKLKGSIGMAMKLTPALEAARPKSKM